MIMSLHLTPSSIQLVTLQPFFDKSAFSPPHFSIKNNLYTILPISSHLQSSIIFLPLSL